MRSFALLCTLLGLGAGFVSGQQIFDVYTTTWDRSSLFSYKNLGSEAANFASSKPSSDATISVLDSQVYQTMDGFGATLTDTSAATMLKLKEASSTKYWELLHTLFDPSDANHNAGFSFLRVTLGASDLSPSIYSFMTSSSFSSFTIAPASALITVLKDIITVNKIIQLHVVPWSPPAYMKTNNNMKGGGIQSKYYSAYANYLYMAIADFETELGHMPYSVAIQNEPENGDGSYPTCKMSVDDVGSIGTALRTQLDHGGMNVVKIIGFEHNWDNAGAFPVQLMKKYGSAFAGVSFHCYAGNFQNQADFTQAYPDKEVYMTECTGTIGSDFWADIKWFTNTLTLGSTSYGARTAMLWNLAANEHGGPQLPGSDSCGGGCRPMVTISGGSYTLNQEYYALAQAQKAVVPKDAGGPRGKRIGVSVGGGSSWALQVNAYVTGRVKSSDWYRYSLVVLNWNDSSSTKFNPQSVNTMINFRGLHAPYTFPVGVTTLSWYASPNGHARSENGTVAIEVTHEGTEQTSIIVAHIEDDAAVKKSAAISRAKTVHLKHARSRLGHH